MHYGIIIKEGQPLTCSALHFLQLPHCLVILVVVSQLCSDTAVKHSDKYVCHIAAIESTSVTLAGRGTDMLLTHHLIMSSSQSLRSPAGHVQCSMSYMLLNKSTTCSCVACLKIFTTTIITVRRKSVQVPRRYRIVSNSGDVQQDSDQPTRIYVHSQHIS